MTPLLVAVILAASDPSSLDCIGAHRKRNDAAIRMRALLEREVERGRLNRAEIGALRSLTARRERLLACGAEREL